MNFRERFEQFKSEKDLAQKKKQFYEFTEREKEAIALEAAAAREERALRGEKHLANARARLAKARESRSQYRPKGVKDTIGSVLWPKAKPKKGKKAGPTFMDDLLGRGPPPKKKGKKKDSFLDGLF